MAGDSWVHNWQLEMQRQVLHGLSILAWQQSADGTHADTAPKPLTFPWEEDPSRGDSVSITEAVTRVGLPEKYIALASAQRG